MLGELLGLVGVLEDDFVSRNRLENGSHTTTWRFSAQFGRWGGCAQHTQNCRHCPTCLLGRELTLLALPRLTHFLGHRTRQIQLVAHTSDQVRPMLKLFGSS